MIQARGGAANNLALGLQSSKVGLMFKPEWIRFNWDLKKLDQDEPKLGGSLEIRKAEPGEWLQVFTVVERSYQAEQGWGVVRSDRIRELRDLLNKGMEDKKIEALVLQDGRRIIGASALLAEEGIPRSLVTGVCVLEEYRCRGAGVALLWKSLKHLADKGLERASVVTRSNLTACKFLYPKFDGTSEKLEELEALKLS